MTDGGILHEQRAELGPEVLDRHRAIRSLMEDVEAVDWYDQRVAVASDRELAEILAHNRDEEKEHAAMILEWLRRRDEGFATEFRSYLGTSGFIKNGLAKAAASLHGLAWFQLSEIRGRIGDSGEPVETQVTMKVGFKLD